jgi:hypothetical protein
MHIYQAYSEYFSSEITAEASYRNCLTNFTVFPCPTIKFQLEDCVNDLQVRITGVRKTGIILKLKVNCIIANNLFRNLETKPTSICIYSPNAGFTGLVLIKEIFC